MPEPGQIVPGYFLDWKFKTARRNRGRLAFQLLQNRLAAYFQEVVTTPAGNGQNPGRKRPKKPAFFVTDDGRRTGTDCEIAEKDEIDKTATT